MCYKKNISEVALIMPDFEFEHDQLCLFRVVCLMAEILDKNNINNRDRAEIQRQQSEGARVSFGDLVQELTDGKGWDSEFFFESAQKEIKEESRGNPFKKALLPFLIGITLKAGSIVPVKMMIMTFVVVMALVFAKLGLVISILLGYLQYQQAHKAALSAVTDKWYIPTTTHSTPASPHSSNNNNGLHHQHDALSLSSSEPKPVTAMSPRPTGSLNNGNPTPPVETKRVQEQQYDPYRYDPFPNDLFKVDAFKFDPYRNDPFRFNRYDYPQ